MHFFDATLVTILVLTQKHAVTAGHVLCLKTLVLAVAFAWKKLPSLAIQPACALVLAVAFAWKKLPSLAIQAACQAPGYIANP